MWRDVQRLDASPRDTSGARAQLQRLTRLAAELEQRARASGEEPDLVRARLLGWELQRIAGRARRPVPAPRSSVAWLPGEAWIAARAFAVCDARTDAMLAALDEAEEEELAPRIERAERILAENLRGLLLDGARALARRLLELEPGTDATRVLVECEIRRGDVDAAEALVSATLAAAATRAADPGLHLAAARVALARDDADAARHALGSALTLGAPEAAEVLARLELHAGHPERARRLAGAWIEAGSGASRGRLTAMWALAQLSRRDAPPAATAPLR